jgi:hypothetical protein
MPRTWRLKVSIVLLVLFGIGMVAWMAFMVHTYQGLGV